MNPRNLLIGLGAIVIAGGAVTLTGRDLTADELADAGPDANAIVCEAATVATDRFGRTIVASCPEARPAMPYCADARVVTYMVRDPDGSEPFTVTRCATDPLPAVLYTIESMQPGWWVDPTPDDAGEP